MKMLWMSDDKVNECIKIENEEKWSKKITYNFDQDNQKMKII